MAYKDCFAHRDRDCCILTERVCDRRRCTFYKTQEEHDERLKKYPPFDYTHYKETGRKIYNGRGINNG